MEKIKIAKMLNMKKYELTTVEGTLAYVHQIEAMSLIEAIGQFQRTFPRKQEIIKIEEI